MSKLKGRYLEKGTRFWGQSVHFSSCDITKHGIYKIGHISAIFKDRGFWFGPKNSIKLFSEDFTICEVIKCISGLVTGGLTIFSIEKCQYLTVAVRHSYYYS